MPECRISVETQPNAKQINFVDEQLYQFNVGKIGEYQYTPLFLFLHNPQNIVVGGLDGFMGLGWLNIGTLWVTEKLRGEGYGRKLVQLAEKEAIKYSCVNAYLFTYSFQNPEFYQHLGYEVFGKLEGFLPGHSRYFLKKTLNKIDKI